MIPSPSLYTTKLNAGLGLLDETAILFDLWELGDNAEKLNVRALASGRFPNVSARRLRNVIVECFAPRYLQSGIPAWFLKILFQVLPAWERVQLMLLLTARANGILHDFIREVYWPAYADGMDSLDQSKAVHFVEEAVAAGKTVSVWSPATRRRVAGYLTGCCADYGLLSPHPRRNRRLVPVHLSPGLQTILVYDLHFSGWEANAVIHHRDWELFGWKPPEVRDALKQLSLKGLLIVQSAGEATRIDWQIKDWEELMHVFAQR